MGALVVAIHPSRQHWESSRQHWEGGTLETEGCICVQCRLDAASARAVCFFSWPQQLVLVGHSSWAQGRWTGLRSVVQSCNFLMSFCHWQGLGAACACSTPLPVTSGSHSVTQSGGSQSVLHKRGAPAACFIAAWSSFCYKLLANHFCFCLILASSPVTCACPAAPPEGTTRDQAAPRTADSVTCRQRQHHRAKSAQPLTEREPLLECNAKNQSWTGVGPCQERAALPVPVPPNKHVVWLGSSPRTRAVRWVG